MTGFFQTYFDILESIDDSLKKERIVPGLILFYSAIDSFSSLAENTNRTGKKVFKDCVKIIPNCGHELLERTDELLSSILPFLKI